MASLFGSKAALSLCRYAVCRFATLPRWSTWSCFRCALARLPRGQQMRKGNVLHVCVKHRLRYSLTDASSADAQPHEARLPAPARSARALRPHAPLARSARPAGQRMQVRILPGRSPGSFECAVRIGGARRRPRGPHRARNHTRCTCPRRRALRPRAPPARSARAHASKILTWTV